MPAIPFEAHWFFMQLATGLSLAPFRSFVQRAVRYWRHHQPANLASSVCLYTPSTNFHAGDFPLCGYCLGENFRAVGKRLMAFSWYCVSRVDWHLPKHETCNSQCDWVFFFHPYTFCKFYYFWIYSYGFLWTCWRGFVCTMGKYTFTK